uniref:Cytosolic flavoprotein A n=1 Tax=Stygiella incarcerata TaxID=1712417 RepID=A0A192ZIW4_9EUKA|nr:cytosolic flavoprotein A [Stygiella incarcerata]|eukprot:TRINITY_DN82230_c0_g1_i1.p1 TRINITY_DN82230_c0_g1~~TRINITY_DN82230_c0_g1_i1.p1  ORF type:complete len:477 (-),score=102.75 TRINITY_DN82230_c0_g1_i1:1313-2743(-)
MRSSFILEAVVLFFVAALHVCIADSSARLPREIAPDVFWVGARDPELRIFDVVMFTEYGTSYNAYIVRGEKKTALIESVKDKPAFFDSLMKGIEDVLGKDGKVDYIVLDHTEPDHSGVAMKLALEKFPEATVVATQAGLNYVQEISNVRLDASRQFVATAGSSIDLGGKTLQFIPAKNLHWPDSMFTFVPEVNVLFTCDFFGAHFSMEALKKDAGSDSLFVNYYEKTAEDFDQTIEPSYRYYFDMIFSPYVAYVIEGLAKVESIATEVHTICPSHGPMMRDTAVRRIIDLYHDWAIFPKRNDTVIIAYVSAYGYTQSLANSIAKGIESVGVTAKLFDMVESPMDDVMMDLDESKGLILGSPTVNYDALPPIWQIALALSPRFHKELVCGSFGSYGWSGEAAIFMDTRFHQIRAQTPMDPLRVKFRPSEKDLEDAVEYGKKFARVVLGEHINERSGLYDYHAVPTFQPPSINQKTHN